jgi:hypothetical protein
MSANLPSHRRLALTRLVRSEAFPMTAAAPEGLLNTGARRIPIESAPDAPVEIALQYHCPDAQSVCVAGDFNDWSPLSTPMSRRGDGGWWETRLTLRPGRYEYKFVVDGEWRHDPETPERVVNELGSFNSVLEVGV